MLIRSAICNGIHSTAWYSPCEAYRYGLSRVWQPQAALLLFVMLNPSTATEVADDPTITRCQTRARALGFGGIRIANLFAYRATDPSDLKRASDPTGPENDGFVVRWVGEAQMILAGWGVHGAHQGRAAFLAPQFAGDVRHLGLTKAGHPRHPLYVSYDTAPRPWPLAERYPSESSDGRV